jgi:hypothetical protein
MKNLKVLLASSILAASAVTGAVGAQTADELITSYRVETSDCNGKGCGSFSLLGRDAVEDFLAQIRSASNGAVNSSSGSGGTKVAKRGPQVVYLDFDASPATFNVLDANGDVFFTFNAHTYTQEERDAVQANLEQDYSDFNFTFTQTQPTEGDFTTLLMNCNTEDAAFPGPVGGACLNLSAAGGLSILFGQAENIDFRNQDMADDAFVDGNLWEFLIQFDPDGSLFTAFSGVPVPVDPETGLVTEEGLAIVNQVTVNQVSNTAAHELGHILGLRHHDSFGAIGNGLPTTGQPNPNSFIPVFDGPSEASETVLHTMASGASAGLTLEGSAQSDRFFSERSSIKITTAERGRLIDEASLGEDRKVKLKNLKAPNTILVGENASVPRFKVKSNVIQGTISESGEVDRYFFKAPRGLTYLNAELVSFSDDNVADSMIGELRVFYVERNGSLTEIASNTQTFEPFDPFILDLQLPEPGNYMIEVTAPNIVFLDLDGVPPLDPFPLDETGNGEFRTGTYELLMYVAGGALRGAPMVPPGQDN